MSIAEDFLATLGELDRHIDIPAIAQIHVAPVQLDAGKSCKFGAIVLDDDTVGLTYVALADTWQHLQDRSAWQTLIGANALRAAELYASVHGWQRALGMAAVNAISQLVFNRHPELLQTAGRTQATLALDNCKQLGMVGYFPSLVRDVRKAGVPLTVIELKQNLLQSADNFTVTADTSALSQCDTVICTGTTLINHTLEDVLAHCQNAREVHVIGPTTGCLPDPLFARGVTTVGGRRVLDTNAFLDDWRRQSDWSECTARYQVSRHSYMGIDSLFASL